LSSACRGEHNDGGGEGIDTPEPIHDIEKEKLLSLIYESKRPYVLVNFFATWCRPCKEELPDLVALQNDPESDIEVVLVSVDKPNDAKTKLSNFLNDFGVSFQTYVRSSNEAALISEFYTYYDGRIPLTLLYHNSGTKLEVFTGMTDRDEIELVVNKHRIMDNAK